jgi:multidrug efflux system membrane fusion protein
MEEFMKKKWMTISIVSIVSFAIMLISCEKKEAPAIEKPIVLEGVKIETIRLSSVPQDYEGVGTIHSKTTSVLSSKTVGHILTVRVHEGDRVRTGQLLIEIDDRDSRAQLQKAQAGLREVQEGLEEIDQNIWAAESARDASEAAKALALATFNRYKVLLDEKSVSRQEFDEIQAKHKIAEAEAERAGRLLQALIAKKSQARAKMDQVKADIAAAQIYMGYSRILSPMNGIVTSKQAEIGLLAAPGVPLLTLEDDSRYRLEVSVEDTMLKYIHLGTPVQISIDAIGPQDFSKQVTEIVPASDPGSRSSTVKIDLIDRKGSLEGRSLLRSGLYGRARFPIGQRQILRVPQKAILHHGQLVSVFAVDPSNLLRLRLIKTGKQYGDRIEVLSGLNDGDRIVVEGLDRAKEGARVQ